MIKKKENMNEEILNGVPSPIKFDSALFVEKLSSFVEEESLRFWVKAVERKELCIKCNLYEFVTLSKLRECAGYDCPYSLLDEYRDEVLFDIEKRFVAKNIKMHRTYEYDPYMPATFTLACVPMEMKQLDKLSRRFLNPHIVKKCTFVDMIIGVLYIIYLFSFMLFRRLSDTLFMFSGNYPFAVACFAFFVLLSSFVIMFWGYISGSLIDITLRMRYNKIEKAELMVK